MIRKKIDSSEITEFYLWYLYVFHKLVKRELNEQGLMFPHLRVISGDYELSINRTYKDRFISSISDTRYGFVENFDVDDSELNIPVQRFINLVGRTWMSGRAYNEIPRRVRAAAMYIGQKAMRFLIKKGL